LAVKGEEHEMDRDSLFAQHLAQIRIADNTVLAAEAQRDVALATLALVTAAVSPEHCSGNCCCSSG
jgi:hypothetical protein